MLPKEILQRKILQVVLIDLLHIETLKLLSQNKGNHALKGQLLCLQLVRFYIAHYLLKYHRDVVDALAVAGLWEDLGADGVENAQICKDVCPRDVDGRIGAKGVLRTEEVNVDLCDEFVFFFCHGGNWIGTICICIYLDVLDFLNDLLVCPFADEFVDVLITLKQ